jgi:methyltransferase (TIGR00027 family)
MPGPDRTVAVRSSRTAETNALERAAESLHPDDRRLLDDPYAHLFVQRRPYRALLGIRPIALRALRYLDARYPGLHAEVVLRARYVDRLLEVGRFDQLVLLGAGYDTTAYRAPIEAGMRVFEVDSPQTQSAKRAIVERNGLSSRASIVYCPCDFELDSVAHALEAGGFDSARAALVVWLGVSCYLTFEAFTKTLREVASVVRPGANLVLDYMDPDVIDGTTAKVGGRRAAEWVVKRGEPYRLGFTVEELDRSLAQTGFALAEHLRTSELAERFRPPAGVWCSTDDWMGVVLAERASGSAPAGS